MQSKVIDHLGVAKIAWPIVLSNVSAPLLGLVDTAVIGNLGEASLIGSIAVAALLFSFLYWGFGFLRMGTTGLIAQAFGAGDSLEIRASVFRAILLALFIGFILLLLQEPILNAALSILDGSATVEAGAASYFYIRIWSAPASLINLSLLGFFLGLQDSRAVLKLQLLLNGVNIVLDIIFVVFLDWGIEGVAFATLIAEYLTLIVALVMLRFILSNMSKGSSPTPRRPLLYLLDKKAIRRMLSVNSDIMVRTICLIFALAWFTNQGAKAGDILLAANSILMQLISFAAFFLDGFALAAESLVGAAIGARNHISLRMSIRLSTELAIVTAVVLSMLFALLGGPIINFLTNVESVRLASTTYLPWVIAAPFVSVFCFQLDGIFIGATATGEMRNAMLLSLLMYLGTFWVLITPFGNHGLWASLLLYYLYRALTLMLYLPRVYKKIT
ncbi:MAG: MATE family efflux transporter [Pseudomonadales bacterium]|nr:MATE family efflux transporter [Pseudomonadales bacterium]